MAEDGTGPRNIKTILTIGIDEKGRVTVSGPMDKKSTCIGLLAQAITIVNNIEPPRIITPTIIPRGPMGPN